MLGDQVLDQDHDPGGVVRAYLPHADVPENVVEEDHRPAVGKVAAGRGHEQPVDLTGVERPQRGCLMLRVPLGVHHHDLVTAALQDVLRRFEDRGVERDGDVGHHHPDEHR
jgi:hypothetical protein